MKKNLKFMLSFFLVYIFHELFERPLLLTWYFNSCKLGILSPFTADFQCEYFSKRYKIPAYQYI